MREKAEKELERLNSTPSSKNEEIETEKQKMKQHIDELAKMDTK